MTNVRTIHVDWYGQRPSCFHGGPQLAYQGDHLSNMVVFDHAPGLPNYYLLVEMKTDDTGPVVALPEIQLEGPYWIIPNYYTQICQQITYQVCCKTGTGDYEHHSAKFKGTILPTLKHEGKPIDWSPMFDPYIDILDKRVDELIVAAGDIQIDSELKNDSGNPVQNQVIKAKIDAVETTVIKLKNDFDKQSVVYTKPINEWRTGYIDSNGVYQGRSGNSCVSTYLNFGELTEVKIKSLSGYMFSLYEYGASETYPFITRLTQERVSEYVLSPGNENNYRLIVSKDDLSSLSNEDLPEDVITYDYYGITDKTLSVDSRIADAKATGDAIRAVDTKVDKLQNDFYVVYTKPINEWRTGYIDSNGVYQGRSGNSCVSTYLNFGEIAEVKIESMSGYMFSLYEYGAAEAYPFITRLTQERVSEYILNPGNENNYRLIVSKDDLSSLSNEDLPEDVVTYSFTKRTDVFLETPGVPADAKVTGDELKHIQKNISAIEKTSRDFADVVDVDVELTDGYGIRYQDGAKVSNQYRSFSGFIDVSGFNRVRLTMIRSTSSTNFGLAFYSDKTEGSMLTSVREGYPADSFAFEVRDIDIPANAKYMRTTWVNSSYAFYNQFFIKLYNNGNVQKIYDRINYCDNLLLNVGLDENGNEVIQNDVKTTEFIEIPQKYGKRLNYTHAFCAAGYSNKVCFYTETKELITTITDASYILNEQSYAYVRCVFSADDTKCSVSFSNESITPQYHPERKYLTYENDLFSYNKIRNSDGAITSIVRTGLMYLKDPQFGYGTEHTAFAAECVMSTKDTHTSSSNYDGMRYQMDCSTYVMLMLMGITPKCSRYFGSKNVPAPWGYRFNELVEYEGYVYGVVQTANTKRLYANSIANYAYKNGFLFVVNDDMSNLQSGDVFFLSNQGVSYNFFENIGHCGMVVDTTPLKTGGNCITTFEGNGGTTSPCKIHTYTSKNEKMVYAARLPLPFVRDPERIAYSKDTVVIPITEMSGRDIDVLDIPLQDPIENGGVYTIILNAEIPNDCYIYVKSNGITYTGYSTENVEQRPDGLRIFHVFVSNLDDVVDVNKFTVRVSCTDDVAGNISINKYSVYNGFVMNHE